VRFSTNSNVLDFRRLDSKPTSWNDEPPKLQKGKIPHFVLNQNYFAVQR